MSIDSRVQSFFFIGNTSYLLSCAGLVCILLFGVFFTFWWFHCHKKNSEPQLECSIASASQQTRPSSLTITSISSLSNCSFNCQTNRQLAGWEHDQPEAFDGHQKARKLGSLITVTSFGPSEIVDTELW